MARFTSTILALVGSSNAYPIARPNTKQAIDITKAFTIVLRKLFAFCMAIKHGNTMRLEIRSAPSNRMPITINTEQRIAIMVLYRLVFTPIALAKDSSIVSAKMWR